MAQPQNQHTPGHTPDGALCKRRPGSYIESVLVCIIFGQNHIKTVYFYVAPYWPIIWNDSKHTSSQKLQIQPIAQSDPW